MSNEQAQRLAENVWVQLLARVAMLITPLLMSAAIAVAAGLQADVRALLMGLREGIYADDQQARALLTAAGLDPDEVLR